jgi:hypothetical protein
MLTRDYIISITNCLATPHMYRKSLGDIAHVLHSVLEVFCNDTHVIGGDPVCVGINSLN